MEQSNIFTAICLLYQDLYSQTSCNSKYIYTPNRNDKVLIIRFIGYLKDNYNTTQTGENFLIKYFRFQFSRYAGVRTPKGTNSVMIGWLIGKKAIAAWEARDINKHYVVNYKINKQFQLSLNTALQSLKKVNVTIKTNKFLNDTHEYEEVEKRKYLNTEEGYIYCLQFTTLYNPNSKNCSNCRFSDNCINRLKTNYQQLYNVRINGADTTRVHN